MIEAKDIPDAIQWHEGMLLSPQHFQQADLRSEVLRAYLLQAAAPYPWGVARIRIDQAALVEGTFSLIELEAVMPDGLLVRYPSVAQAQPLQLDLHGVGGPDGSGAIAIHAAVAARAPDGAAGGPGTRFRSVEGPEVLDENTGDNALPVPRLVPALGLHATDGPLRLPPSRYVGLPVAVVRAGGEGFRMMEYEPPCLRVGRESLLHRLCGDVAAELRRKAKTYSEVLSGAVFQGREQAVSASQSTLRSLLRGLPRLEAMLETGVAQPFPLFLALCDIAGDLAVLGDRVSLPPPPRYTHADPLSAYRAVAKLIFDALALLRTPHRSIAFTRAAPGRFEVALPASLPAEALTLGARLQSGRDAPSLVAWFDRALIGGAQRIADMRLSRILGARRAVTGSVPELDLTPPPNMLLFRVSADGDFIRPGQTLQVAGGEEGDGEPAEIELFLPAEGGAEQGAR